MTIGTLRDQIIYPDTPEQMQGKGFTDEGLAKYLEQVQLGPILERENGWNAVQVRYFNLLTSGVFVIDKCLHLQCPNSSVLPKSGHFCLVLIVAPLHSLVWMCSCCWCKCGLHIGLYFLLYTI